MPSYLADLDNPYRNASDPEEDDQDYLAPPSISGSAAPPTDAFLSAPSKADLFGTVVKDANPTNPNPPRVKAAYEAVQSVNARRPERQKPGFWRGLAAIGVGLGAGYSNATGKFAQQDVNKTVDNIANGGYNRKMADWQQKQQDALQTLKAAEEADKGEQDYLSEPVKRDYMKAETAHMGSNIDKIHHDIDSEKARDRYLTLKDGSVYDTKTQSTIWKPQTPPDERLQFAKDHGWDPSQKEIRDWIMDGKSPNDAKPDRMQLVEGADGFHVVDMVTKQDTKLGIPPKPKTDPADLQAQRDAAHDQRQQNQFDQNNRRNDQMEIDKLQKQEQDLHRLRGAIGREMRKGANEVLTDPTTGKVLLDANKKPLKRSKAPAEHWQILQEQLDQATRQAQDLNDQQKRLAQRNGGGGAPGPANDPLNLRQ